MNLLPFTVIFILIISLSSLAFFQGHATTALSSTLFSAFMKAHVEARNQVERDNFKLHVPKDPPKPNDKGTPSPAPPSREGKHYISFRTKLRESSKFNLAPLFKEHSNSIVLQDTLVRLIKELYSKTDLFKEQKNPKLSEQIAKEILKAASKLTIDKSLDFPKITLPNPDLNLIWYKMLRGTTKYNLDTHEGWPPFTLYATINTDETKAVALSKASIPLLKSFLGDDTTRLILEREKQKYYDNPGKSSVSSDEEIKSILEECSLTDRTLFAAYNFKPHNNKKWISKQDPQSDITASFKKTPKQIHNKAK